MTNTLEQLLVLYAVTLRMPSDRSVLVPERVMAKNCREAGMMARRTWPTAIIKEIYPDPEDQLGTDPAARTAACIKELIALVPDQAKAEAVLQKYGVRNV